MKDKKPRSDVQQNLLNLYLRLSGFFVTGFIVHSPDPGKSRTEIDALAIRLPFNNEPEREILPSPYLDISSDFTDLLICEVKSRGQSLQFNPALRNSIPAIESVLRWAGLFNEDEVLDLAPKLQAQLQPPQFPRQDIPTVQGPRNTRIRGIICSPERLNRQNNQTWFINGTEILNYLWRCFCPSVPRATCSTRYDFVLWGESYERIVRYFKSRSQNQGAGVIGDLYKHLGV